MTPTHDFSANPICVALDSADAAEVARLAGAVEDHVGLFKIGLTTFVANGSPLVAELARRRPVFLDLKLHDIPTQVGGAAAAAARTGASYLTVHASGGGDMVRAAVEGAGSELSILGVTILTSLDESTLRSVGIMGSVEGAVIRLAEIAMDAGVAGLVCSPHEVAAVRSRFGPRSEGGPLLVVPGIRPQGTKDDQRRTLQAAGAVAAGADVLVIGRPITAAPDPAAAARSILGELGEPGAKT